MRWKKDFNANDANVAISRKDRRGRFHICPPKKKEDVFAQRHREERFFSTESLSTESFLKNLASFASPACGKRVMTKSFNDKIIERGGIKRLSACVHAQAVKGRKEEYFGVTQRSSLQVKNAINLEG